MFKKKAPPPPRKSFHLKPDQIAEIAPGHGACFATDRITVDGARVGYAYREPPDMVEDSGWRFFAGDESEEYLADPANVEIYDVNLDEPQPILLSGNDNRQRYRAPTPAIAGRGDGVWA